MIKLSKAPIDQPSDNLNSEIMPEYKTIEKITINKNLLASLVKFSENPSNNHVEGILFGHEEEHEIVVDSAIPLAQGFQNVNENCSNIVKFLL